MVHFLICTYEIIHLTSHAYFSVFLSYNCYVVQCSFNSVRSIKLVWIRQEKVNSIVHCSQSRDVECTCWYVELPLLLSEFV